MYQFTSPDKLLMGDNIVANAVGVFPKLGKHALIVTGPHVGKSTMVATLERTLDNDRVRYTVLDDIMGEPTVSMITRGAKF